MKFINNIW